MNLLKKKILKKFFAFALVALLLTPATLSLPENGFFAKIDTNLAYAEDGWIDKLGEFVTDFIWYATVWIPYKILVFVGSIFDYVFKHTIINFAGWYNEYFASSADAVWNISQSIANLIIISMFVFSAIATILRIESYELKQFIVKILIVAVLINFSMFFAKLAIDVSNTVAYSIYKSSFAKAELDSKETNIGDTIAYLTGFVQKSYETDGKKPPIYDSDWEAFLMFVIIMAPFMLFSAGILIYGTIVMITRALGLIFVIALSAFGFVAMIIPKAENVWTKWWQSLMNYSLFAPAFTLLLYIDYVLIANMKKDIASLIIDDNNYAAAAINSFVIAGSLLLAIKLANEIGIAGSKLAGKLTGGAMSLAFWPALNAYTGVRRAALTKLATTRALGATNLGLRVQHWAAKEAGKDKRHIGDTMLGTKLRDKFGIDLGKPTAKLSDWDRSELEKFQTNAEIAKLQKKEEAYRKKLGKMGLSPDEIERAVAERFGERTTQTNNSQRRDVGQEAMQRAEQGKEEAARRTEQAQRAAEEADEQRREETLRAAEEQARNESAETLKNTEQLSGVQDEKTKRIFREFLREVKRAADAGSINKLYGLYQSQIKNKGYDSVFSRQYPLISLYIDDELGQLIKTNPQNDKSLPRKMSELKNKLRKRIQEITKEEFMLSDTQKRNLIQSIFGESRDDISEEELRAIFNKEKDIADEFKNWLHEMAQKSEKPGDNVYNAINDIIRAGIQTPAGISGMIRILRDKNQPKDVRQKIKDILEKHGLDVKKIVTSPHKPNENPIEDLDSSSFTQPETAQPQNNSSHINTAIQRKSMSVGKRIKENIKEKALKAKEWGKEKALNAPARLWKTFVNYDTPVKPINEIYREAQEKFDKAAEESARKKITTWKAKYHKDEGVKTQAVLDKYVETKRRLAELRAKQNEIASSSLENISKILDDQKALEKFFEVASHKADPETLKKADEKAGIKIEKN